MSFKREHYAIIEVRPIKLIYCDSFVTEMTELYSDRDDPTSDANTNLLHLEFFRYTFV